MDVLTRVVFWAVLALVAPGWLFAGAWALQEGEPLVGVLLISAGTLAAFTGFAAAQRGRPTRGVLWQWVALAVFALLWVLVLMQWSLHH